MKPKTTTTTKMRKAAHNLITLCNQFDQTGDRLYKVVNAREWDRTQDEIREKAREIEHTLRDMLNELNVILCAGDVLDIQDFYRISKETL